MTLFPVRSARHGRDGFVIAAAQIDREIVEGSDLMFEKVVPGDRLVFLETEWRSGMHRNKVLVLFLNIPEVAQVPVETIALGFHLGGNGRNHEVATVAAVAGDGEGPCCAGGLRSRSGGEGGQEQENHETKSARNFHAKSIAHFSVASSN